MKRRSRLALMNFKLARNRWGKLGKAQLIQLGELSDQYKLSIALGDVFYLDERIYVTHAGLLRLAQNRMCAGIRVCQVQDFCDPTVGRWVFKATVYRTPRSKGFVGYGDADPSNVSALVRGAEMRVAETRAVNRALRKAYGIGLCSVEELGHAPRREQANGNGRVDSRPKVNNSGNGKPRLRDRLCLLMRHHQLDPTLVKSYAADFCGIQELREASRELVESFIAHLAEWAAKDRVGLVCKLNSYTQSQEVHQ